MRRLILVFILGLVAGPALADAIDGDWCGAGKHLSILGPKITLPSGAVIEGQYRRHEFSYQVPTGDVAAGSLIYMQLLDEEDMNLYHMQDGKPGEAEAWKRCAPSTTS
jgi:hypothetical protein